MSYTNSSLACARRCLTEYDWRYLHRMERDGEKSEALQVGSAWAAAHDAHTKGLDAYAVLKKVAPGELWFTKLSRLLAAHLTHYSSDGIEIEESEATWKKIIDGVLYEGQRDGGLRSTDGRIGLYEMKTTGDSIVDGSAYWNRLPMDVQTGLYALSMPELPSFIVYDVTKKPGINPKNVPKKDAARMLSEIATIGHAQYFGEIIDEANVEASRHDGRETLAMYGARLTAEISNEPGKFFQRRLVERTAADFETLRRNLHSQVSLIEHAKANDLLHRNPDSCHSFSRPCDFVVPCASNVRPSATPPTGFHVREHEHPELATNEEA